MSRLPTLSSGVLTLGCCGLAAVVALQLAGDVSLAPRVTAAAPPAPALPEADPVEFSPPPADAFSVISERPLFSATRQPFVPPAEETPVETAVAAPEEPLLVELVGVVLTERQQAVMVQEEGERVPRRVNVGQSVDGWRVVSVARDGATFQRGDAVQKLRLRRD